MAGPRRNTGRLVADLRSLLRFGGNDRNREASLAAANNGIPIESTVSESRLREGGGGSGIASPLSEPSAAARTYHPVQEIVSVDGFLVIEVEPIEAIDMLDALGREVNFGFDEP